MPRRSRALRGLVEITLAMQQAESEQARQLAAGNIKQVFENWRSSAKSSTRCVIGMGMDSASQVAVPGL